MSMRILIAPSGFKENLPPDEVADCIEAGVLRAAPDAQIRKLPLVDGGEGFAKILVKATGGTIHTATVTGPIGQPVEAHYGFLGGLGPKTAVFEMASAAGLRLVPKGQRHPLKTTTYGVGELIKAAMDAGAQRVLIGCADSGTTDGGAGMAQALGVRLLDGSGNEIGRGGSELSKLARIDLSGRDPRIGKVQIDVACNWHTILCGPGGCARLFGPQKGASPEEVEQLAAALDRYAEVVERETGIDVRAMPGGGAAGGLGAGLHAFLKANLHHRYDVVMKYLEIDRLLRDAHLVFTGEGCLDYQTPWGKIPGEVARRAKPYNIPVVALVGMIGEGARESFFYGLGSYSSILETPVTLSQSMDNAQELLARASERVMRMILVGQNLKRLSTASEELAEHCRLYEQTQSIQSELALTTKVTSELLNTIYRDLRTPLNLVMAYAGMMKDRFLGEISPEQERALAQVIKHSLASFSLMSGILKAQQANGIQFTMETSSPLTPSWMVRGKKASH